MFTRHSIRQCFTLTAILPLFCSLLVPFPLASSLPMTIRVENHRILVDDEAFFIRGVNYFPAPIGTSPAWTQPFGDYYTNYYRGLWVRDFPLIRNLGANTIRIANWHNDEDHTWFLDSAHEYGLKVIVTFSVGNAGQFPNPFVLIDSFAQQFNRYVNHPALLGWSFGSDINGNWNGFLGKFNEIGQCKYNGNDFNADHIGCYNNPDSEGYCFEANQCVYKQLMNWINSAAIAAKNMMRGSQEYVLQHKKQAIIEKRKQIEEQKQAERQKENQAEAEKVKQLQEDKAKSTAQTEQQQNQGQTDSQQQQTLVNNPMFQRLNLDDVDASIDPESLGLPNGLQHLIFASFSDVDVVAARLGHFQHYAPDVDAFGIASYRNAQFKWEGGQTNLIQEYGSNGVKKPMIVTEYGVDAYSDPCGNSGHSPCYNTMEDDANTGHGEDEEVQANWVMSLTELLSANDSAVHEDGLVAGGIVQEFVDEWWKSSQGVSGCGGPVPYGMPGFDTAFCGWKAHVECPNMNLWVQKQCGYWTPSSFDHYNNLAYFGIMKPQVHPNHVDTLIPRLVYTRLQAHWAAGPAYWWLLLWLAVLAFTLAAAYRVLRHWHFLHTGEHLKTQSIRDFAQLKQLLTDGLLVQDLEHNNNHLVDDEAAEEWKIDSTRTPLLQRS